MILDIMLVIISLEEFISQTLTADRAFLMHDIDAPHMGCKFDVIKAIQSCSLLAGDLVVERRRRILIDLAALPFTGALGSVPIIQHVAHGLLRGGRLTNLLMQVEVVHAAHMLTVLPCLQSRDTRPRPDDNFVSMSPGLSS